MIWDNWTHDDLISTQSAQLLELKCRIVRQYRKLLHIHALTDLEGPNK
jgi:hypothetical protein